MNDKKDILFFYYSFIIFFIRGNMMIPVSLIQPNIAWYREPGEQIKAFWNFQKLLPFTFLSPSIWTVPMVGKQRGKGTKERVTTARSRSWHSFRKIFANEWQQGLEFVHLCVQLSFLSLGCRCCPCFFCWVVVHCCLCSPCHSIRVLACISTC